MKKPKTSPSVVNEIKVSYTPSFCPVIKVRSAGDVVSFLREMFSHNQCQVELREYFFIVCLNRANKITSYYLLSVGGISGTVADVRIAFAIALKCLASGIIICHNHPSGNLKPSDNDIKLTRRFREIGNLLEIPLIDHIILTIDGYFSFEEHGIE